MLAVLPLISWLWLAQLPAATPAAITSDEVVEEQTPQVAVARGHVLVRTAGFVLHTDALRYHQDTGRFESPGPIFGVDGTTLITASRAEGAIAGELTLHDVQIDELQWVSPDLGVQASSAAQIRQSSKLLMSVRGKTLRRLGPEHYKLDGVVVSPCACPVPERCRPDWSLASGNANVHSGSYALLSYPEIRIADFPLPLLRPPLLYVPLGGRRSGLLLPHLNWQGQNGLLVDEPFYLTLGASADVTISAGYISGASEKYVPASGPGTAASLAGGGANGVQGPRASAELRYAPAVGTTGRLFVGILDDSHHDLDFAAPDTPEVRRGPRGTLRELQIQDFGAHDGDRIDLSMVSDARLTSQLTTDLLFAQIPATRSSAFFFHRADDWILTIDGVFLQDFQGDFALTNPHALLFGPGAPHTLSRLPAFTATLPEEAIARSPFRFSFSGSLLREGVLGAGADSLSLAPQPATTVPSGSLVPVTSTLGSSLTPALAVQQARVGVEQLDLLPAFSLPWQLGRFATGTLSAKWREDLWLFEGSPAVPDLSSATAFAPAGARGYPIFDAQAGTELSRAFDAFGAKLRHTIAPEVELRALPFQLLAGTVPPLWVTPTSQILDHSTHLPVATSMPLPYDELSLAPGLTAPTSTAPGSLAASSTPGGIAQGKLHLDQRLRTHNGDFLRFDVGENFDGAGAESTYGLVALTRPWFHLNGFADWSNKELPCPQCSATDRTQRRLTEAFGEGGVNDARGDGFGLTFVRAIAAGAPRLSAPLDVLFAPTLAPNDPRWALPDVSQLGAYANVHPWTSITLHGSASYQLPASTFSQISLGAGYNSSQHCCSLDLNAVFQPAGQGQGLGFAAFFVSLDLGEFAGSTSH